MSPETDDDQSGQREALAFEWHAEKARANVKKHGVTFEEAKTIFGDENHLLVPDRGHSYDELRYLAIGRSDTGRLLTVCFTERGPALRLISARTAEAWERREYELTSKQE